jgi:hypothetical protein
VAQVGVLFSAPVLFAKAEKNALRKPVSSLGGVALSDIAVAL